MKKGAKAIDASVPTFRRDLERPIDLIEEVARIHGYDAIPETLPVVKVHSLVRQRFAAQESAVRASLLGAGLTETVLAGFTSEESLKPFEELGRDPVRIVNPLSVEEGAMRTTLLTGLLDAARLNANRQRSDLRLFALQRVFRRPMGIGPSEEPRFVAGLMSGRRNSGSWERSREMFDFYDAKGVVEDVLDAFGLGREAIFQRGEAYRFLHPGEFAYLIVSGKRSGFVGRLHPDVAGLWDLEQGVFVFELHFEELSEIALASAPRFAELSKFPFVERDLAILVEERIPAVEVEKAIQDSGVDLLGSVNIFDVYRGDGVVAGRKSLAVTLKFSRSDRTLTDEEVEAAQSKIVGDLRTKLGAELRS